MAFLPFLLGLIVVLNLVLLVLVIAGFQRWFGNSSQVEALTRLASQSEALQQALSGQFAAATADMAQRLEQTKGDLRQQVADRLGSGIPA